MKHTYYNNKDEACQALERGTFVIVILSYNEPVCVRQGILVPLTVIPTRGAFTTEWKNPLNIADAITEHKGSLD